jgi:hypothetical protein
MSREMTYDQRCYDLALVFLPNGGESEVRELASTIQRSIEDWLDDHERPKVDNVDAVGAIYGLR